MLRHVQTRSRARSGAIGSDKILGLLDDFNHAGPNGRHVCLVFKAMGPDTNDFRGLFPKSRISVPVAKKISRDLLQSLVFLHEHCDIIHTGTLARNSAHQAKPEHSR